MAELRLCPSAGTVGRVCQGASPGLFARVDEPVPLVTSPFVPPVSTDEPVCTREPQSAGTGGGDRSAHDDDDDDDDDDGSGVSAAAPLWSLLLAAAAVTALIR